MYVTNSAFLSSSHPLTRLTLNIGAADDSLWLGFCQERWRGKFNTQYVPRGPFAGPECRLLVVQERLASGGESRRKIAPKICLCAARDRCAYVVFLFAPHWGRPLPTDAPSLNTLAGRRNLLEEELVRFSWLFVFKRFDHPLHPHPVVCRRRGFFFFYLASFGQAPSLLANAFTHMR